MSATVVLVHGAWHGAWCWDRVLRLLERAGVPTVAIDLPGHGASGAPLGDLASDAAALSASLDDIDGPTVVCGHSYGGAVITEGAAGNTAVGHLVYLTAFCLEPGEACTNAASGALADGEGETLLGPAIRFADDGTVTLDPDLAIPALYNDCTPADAAWAVDRLDAQSMAELSGVATRAAWHDTPSTYVVCTRDRAVAPAQQRVLAQRCAETLTWDTGHSPFLSRPDLVADLLTGLSRQH